MPMAFDVSVNQNDEGMNKYEMSISFRGEEESTKVASFRKMMDDIDQFNITWATENSEELFGEDLTKKRDLVEDRYNPLVKLGKKKEYSPTFRVKLQTKMDSEAPEFQLFDKDKQEMSFYDAESNVMNLDFLTRNTDTVLLIEYGGMWVVGKKFGSNWRLIQGKVYSGVKDIGCQILDCSDDEEPNPTPQEVVKEEEEAVKPPDPVLITDDASDADPI